MAFGSKGSTWTGWIMSGLVILFMLFDSISKLFRAKAAVDGSTELGFAEHHVVTIGLLGLISVLLYLYPKTAVLGAILLTGYFGGAVVTHFRLDNPLFSFTLFPVYVGILSWGGLWLRNEEVRCVFPLYKKRGK
ncbi:DoxX-like family protein [Fictibacillus solisalsi]|uniref:DoxX-like family protein n=1 Tax=Fictibacillus solisalsi TaxID=459525 RepID=A0A1G9VQK5_9BACL|nr:DoxX family protein [Fictibacillus solisalsi]SDM74115.1 DoxX-like family protein [Fictibacillus solisalsi]